MFELLTSQSGRREVSKGILKGPWRRSILPMEASAAAGAIGMPAHGADVNIIDLQFFIVKRLNAPWDFNMCSGIRQQVPSES